MGIIGLEYARLQGLGLDCFVSLGNKVDVSENDLIAYLADRNNTAVALAYLENFADVSILRSRCDEFIRKAGKPLILLKGGRSKQGRRAAASHTGALAGGDRATDDILEQLGIITASGIRTADLLAC